MSTTAVNRAIGALDPSTWDATEVAEYMNPADWLRSYGPTTGTGRRAMLIGSTGPFAQLAGRKALINGGNAVDAAMTTALAQVALAVGSWVSYAGIMSAVYYEAATGKLHSMSAPFATFRGETDAATIPASPEPSGRTALVPGFFAGVQALHDRFGSLEWSDIFAPAIWVAEEGFKVISPMDAVFNLRKDVLTRTPEGREIFTDEKGALPQKGARFKQPQLAATLRAVVANGTDHIYRGPWAEKFVDIVRREGGHASIDDLQSYQAIWSEPLRGEVYGHELAAVGLPNVGGAGLIEALHLYQEAGLGDPTTDAESLYWLIQITRQSSVWMQNGFPTAQRVTREHARSLWAQMERAGRFVTTGRPTGGSHSDFICAADEQGNLIAVCHSINTGMWGATGIFIDGISIPDAASHQQALLAEIKPGEPFPNPMNPAIALKDGRPVLASSSIGSGLHDVTTQCLLGVLGRGLDVSAAAALPLVHAPDFDGGNDDPEGISGAGVVAKKSVGGDGVRALMEAAAAAASSPLDVWPGISESVPQVATEGFAPELLEAVSARGVRVTVPPASTPTFPRGYWVGLAIDPDTGALTGAHTGFANGRVEGI
ncbi:MAG: gamma-glutamyltransferase [Candidatus Dormibacteria bacterium]